MGAGRAGGVTAGAGGGAQGGYVGGGEEADPVVLDMNDFPSLGGRSSGPSGPSAGPGGVGGLHGALSGDGLPLGADPYGAAAAMQQVRARACYAMRRGGGERG